MVLVLALMRRVQVLVAVALTVTLMVGCGAQTRPRAKPHHAQRPSATGAVPTPQKRLITAGPLGSDASYRKAGYGIAPRGTVVPSGNVLPGDQGVWTDRVFASRRIGFALANYGAADYPVETTDGGKTRRIDGPWFSAEIADGAWGVGYVGVAGPRSFFAYGSSAVDVTTDGGRTWWACLLGESVQAVVAGGGPDDLIAYVQDQAGQGNAAVTSQYVSDNGGRTWNYNTNLDG